MRVFQKIKSAKLRYALAGAAMVAVFGVGNMVGRYSEAQQTEDKIGHLNADFSQKEAFYQEKITHLLLKCSKFRFYDYDASGWTYAELEKVRNAPLPEELKNRFGKYRLREIAPAEITRLDTLWHRQGKKFRDLPDNRGKLAVLGERLRDTIAVWGDEAYLQDAAEYRKLMVTHLCKVTRGGRDGSLKAFKLSNDELQQELKMWGYRKDAKAELMAALLEMRMVVKMNNAIIDDMKVADSAMFRNNQEYQVVKMKEKGPQRSPEWKKWLDNGFFSKLYPGR